MELLPIDAKRKEINESFCHRHVFAEKAKNIFLSILSNPYNIISLISLILLIYLIIVPFGEIFLTTIQWQPKDIRISPDAIPANLTLFQWKSMLTGRNASTMLYRPLLNSLTVALCVSAIFLFLGGSMAWIVTRTDLPGEKFISFSILIPYMLPSWYESLAWITVFKNDRIGGYPGFLQAIFEINPPNWAPWFNNKRLLQPIGNIPPAEYEQMYYTRKMSLAHIAGLT